MSLSFLLVYPKHIVLCSCNYGADKQFVLCIFPLILQIFSLVSIFIIFWWQCNNPMSPDYPIWVITVQTPLLFGTVTVWCCALGTVPPAPTGAALVSNVLLGLLSLLRHGTRPWCRVWSRTGRLGVQYTLPGPGPKVGTVGVAPRLWCWHTDVTPVDTQASGSNLANMSGLVRERKWLEMESFVP